ncbi:MAG TPA: type II toxin-antitoxin system prevent-host-death family antitoxin [Burkholderiales bacterium]|jgi:prevent-host-death family protein|nr:type II toxin-antitoxin system prevent-host-death family antitoxin [Burkholderiales bacterium]
MDKTINAKELRASLPRIVERVRRGERFTVLYRSRPAFRVVPPDEAQQASGSFRDDSLYRAGAVGRSTDGLAATDHDTALYGRK